ncbi:MAG: hypothetical protein AAB560_01645 [Patescibacteria group bacterium]
MNIREKIKRFIARLQESDDRTKKIWVAVFSSIAMVFATGLWLIQIGNSVAVLDDVGEESDARPDFSSWQTVRAGLAEIGGAIDTGWQKLEEGRSVIIENKTPNFAAKNAEEIRPVPLR